MQSCPIFWLWMSVTNAYWGAGATIVCTPGMGMTSFPWANTQARASCPVVQPCTHIPEAHMVWLYDKADNMCMIILLCAADNAEPSYCIMECNSSSLPSCQISWKAERNKGSLRHLGLRWACFHLIIKRTMVASISENVNSKIHALSLPRASIKNNCTKKARAVPLPWPSSAPSLPAWDSAKSFHLAGNAFKQSALHQRCRNKITKPSQGSHIPIYQETLRAPY